MGGCEIRNSLLSSKDVLTKTNGAKKITSGSQISRTLTVSLRYLFWTDQSWGFHRRGRMHLCVPLRCMCLLLCWFQPQRSEAHPNSWKVCTLKIQRVSHMQNENLVLSKNCVSEVVTERIPSKYPGCVLKASLGQLCLSFWTQVSAILWNPERMGQSQI